VIVAGARTPFGKFGGAFKEIPAKSLCAPAFRGALDRSGVEGKDVDSLIVRRPQP
jgi:acetyl-CoA C-acetyltransferase